MNGLQDTTACGSMHLQPQTHGPTSHINIGYQQQNIQVESLEVDQMSLMVEQSAAAMEFLINSHQLAHLPLNSNIDFQNPLALFDNLNAHSMSQFNFHQDYNNNILKSGVDSHCKSDNIQSQDSFIIPNTPNNHISHSIFFNDTTSGKRSPPQIRLDISLNQQASARPHPRHSTRQASLLNKQYNFPLSQQTASELHTHSSLYSVNNTKTKNIYSPPLSFNNRNAAYNLRSIKPTITKKCHLPPKKINLFEGLRNKSVKSLLDIEEDKRSDSLSKKTSSIYQKISTSAQLKNKLLLSANNKKISLVKIRDPRVFVKLYQAKRNYFKIKQQGHHSLRMFNYRLVNQENINKYQANQEGGQDKLSNDSQLCTLQNQTVFTSESLNECVPQKFKTKLQQSQAQAHQDARHLEHNLRDVSFENQEDKSESLIDLFAGDIENDKINNLQLKERVYFSQNIVNQSQVVEQDDTFNLREGHQSIDDYQQEQYSSNRGNSPSNAQIANATISSQSGSNSSSISRNSSEERQLFEIFSGLHVFSINTTNLVNNNQQQPQLRQQMHLNQPPTQQQIVTTRHQLRQLSNQNQNNQFRQISLAQSSQSSE
eukprot:403364910